MMATVVKDGIMVSENVWAAKNRRIRELEDEVEMLQRTINSLRYINQMLELKNHPDFLSAADIAKMLDVSIVTVHKWMDRGEIPVFQAEDKSRRRVPYAGYLSFLERHMTGR